MLGSSFHDLVYFSSLKIAFGFEVEPESGICIIRKISILPGWVYRLKNINGYYNEVPGKQLRKNSLETILGVVTKANKIEFLGLLHTTNPTILF
jgi:hypothetical protein